MPDGHDPLGTLKRNLDAEKAPWMRASLRTVRHGCAPCPAIKSFEQFVTSLGMIFILSNHFTTTTPSSRTLRFRIPARAQADERIESGFANARSELTP